MLEKEMIQKEQIPQVQRVGQRKILVEAELYQPEPAAGLSMLHAYLVKRIRLSNNTVKMKAQ